MRQLSVTIGTAVAGGLPGTIISAIVPPNSWANNKVMWIRGFYQFTIAGGGLPPMVNVTESIASTQGGPTLLPTPGAFAPVAGTFSTWIQRNLVRIGSNIYVWDFGDTMQKNFANRNDNVQHVIQHVATAPPFDFSVQMQVDVRMIIPGGLIGSSITCLFGESFLEQATNLGGL
jgi:hypothetical protein